MSDQDNEMDEFSDDPHGEPANKRRKTGADTFVNIDVEAEAQDEDEDEDDDDDMTTNNGLTGNNGGGEEEDDLDGFIANEEDIEAEWEQADRYSKRHHHKRRKKRRRKHKSARITEDTLRMLAETRGETYKPDIDIDQGLSDESDQQSDEDSDNGGGTRRLKKRVMDFDEESVMGDGNGMSDDDFHDFGDEASVVDGGYDNSHNHNRHGDDHSYDERRSQRVADDDFVVQDEITPSRYASSYDDNQIVKLHSIFGVHIYDFLGIPKTQEILDEDSDEEKDEELIEIEKKRKAEEAKKSEEKLKDFKRGLQGLDAKQKQKVINIINTDIPERLQERINKTDDAQITAVELSKEAGWILRQPYFTKAQANHRQFNAEQIVRFLKYFRIQFYDVPYIITYLQDEYSHDVKPADIWKIDELDEKYQQIYLRKINIENYLRQIKQELTENIEKKKELGIYDESNDENNRWLERVEEAKVFLYDAGTHEELEAVDLFLNIIPTTDEDGISSSLFNDPKKNENEKRFPEAPHDLITAECIDYINRFGAFTPETADRQQFEDIANEIEHKMNRLDDEEDITSTQIEIDELKKVAAFYQDCIDDPQNAATKELDNDEFQGEEAFSFIGAALEDREELEQSIRQIMSRAQQLEDYKIVKEKEYKDQKGDYETVHQYFQQCLSIMPKVKRTKKAASILRNGKNNGRGRAAFKLSIPKCLSPLCQNIGYSKVVADNVKKSGRVHGSIRSEAISGIVVEQGDLHEVCQKISNENITRYAKAEDVKLDVIYHLARHIGHEPEIKKWISKQLEENGVISTQPTLKGRDLIEWTDELAAVKRLENKPINKFLQDYSDNVQVHQPMNGMNENLPPELHWLLINKGTKANLLRNHMTIEQGKLNDLKSSYHEVNYVDTYYENAENTIKFFLYKLAPMFIDDASESQWKDLKLRILHDALNLYLIPTAMKWIQHKMLEHDEDRVIEKACTELKYLSNVAGERENLRGKNILSIIVGEENSPSFLVLLNHFGDVIDETMLHYMKSNVRVNPQGQTVISTHDRLQLEKKNGDIQLFKEFVSQHKPELIVIDAGNLLARNFKEDIQKALAANDATQSVRVEYVDPCVSLLYRNSDDAIKEFQSWSVCQRQAVSLGRFVLDPITELTKRWCIDSKTGKNEMLSLPLHKNMNDVDPNKILKAFRRVLMDITNEVGVMLNLSSQRDFLNGPIQFISGLGPHKAKNIIYELKKRGRFASRDEIIKRHILQATVYKNAIGFIRINHLLDRPSSGNDPLSHSSHRDRDRDIENTDDEDEEDEIEETKINLLDDTRIHPDDYHWATVVVISAMDIDEESAYSNETLMDLRRPDNLNKLEILNLDIFAERIRRRRGKRIVHKLYLIKQEVREGFKETRPAFKQPTEDELYHLLCGQTRASLREGMLVNVEIRSINSSGIRCRLPSCGLDAWLPAQTISIDIRNEFQSIKNKYNGDINSEECKTQRKDLILSFLKQKSHLEARVISIDKAMFSVKLSCLKSDMQNESGQHEDPLNADGYLVRNHIDDDSKKAVEKDRRERLKNRPLHRNIKYSEFHNITREEAIKKLKNQKGCGQLLFRPSSRGLNFLSMTWKMADNPDIFVHYVIEEKDKPNPYAVGQTLVIDGEKYDDLDEIYTHHKPKLNELVSTMINHKNFRYGTENDIQEMLQDEINANSRTVYALSYSYERPGHFLLSYIIARSRSSSSKSHKVQREYIGLTYTGYRFRRHYFETPTKLINWWKTNFKKNHPKNVQKAKMYAKQSGSSHHQQSLNDDVMFNNHHDNGYHHPMNNQQHQPPPPHHGNHPPPHHGGYGGYHGGGGHGGHHYNDNHGHNGHNGHHRNGDHYRRRSRSREPRGANGYNNGYNSNSHNGGGGGNNYYNNNRY